MKVLILGIDGYIGYPLAIHLLKRDHIVYGVDNFSRLKRVNEIGSESLTPIASIDIRRAYLISNYKNFAHHMYMDLGRGYSLIKAVLRNFNPDTVIHLAEQPSAPWSMIDSQHASVTQFENVTGTLDLLWAMKEVCPTAHLIKIGTMGEYGTPNCDIPEGKIPEGQCSRHGGDVDCPMSGLLFPRTAGSFYHLSKVHDTHNIEFACRNWDLHSTDIMQGIVFGLNETDDKSELTRFDYDEYFGTVLNRFCVQSIIGHSLTIYGKGNQTRGFLPLKDSIQCLTIALENPPKYGEYRTLNQFENIYSVNHLAEMVVESVRRLGLSTERSVIIKHIPNPRIEAEDHYYKPVHQKLFDLGYVPTTDIQGEIATLIKQLLPYKDRVRKEVIMPRTIWR